MIKNFKELSQVLAVVGISISSSQEEQILAAVKNLFVSLEVIEEESHDTHSQEDIKVSSNHIFQSIEDTREPWATFDEGKPLEPKIEESFPCLSLDPLCIQETNDPEEDDLHAMIEEDIQNGPHEKVK